MSFSSAVSAHESPHSTANSSNSNPSHSASVSASVPSKSRYFFGLLLLFFVVILWVVSGALIQFIFSDDSFESPFFLTYLSNSLFTLYLFSYLLISYWHYFLKAKFVAFSRRHRAFRFEPLNEENSALNSIAQKSSRSSVHVDPASASSLFEWISLDLSSRGERSLSSTARLSLLFCPLWFPLNYFYNLSLSLTSIASSTIISSTSSLFVLLFSILFLGERPQLINLLGVGCAIAGAAIISLRDQADSTDGPDRSFRGDLLAALGALFYGIYSVNLQLKIPDDSKISMQLFFGFIGLFNALMLWPGFFILHWSGIENFQWPSGPALGFLFLNGLIGTVLSDFLWAQSVLRTSPLIATMGITFTIPLAMLFDSVAHHRVFGPIYVIGSLLVLSGFVAVNWKFSKNLESKQAENRDQIEDEHEEIIHSFDSKPLEDSANSTAPILSKSLNGAISLTIADENRGKLSDKNIYSDTEEIKEIDKKQQHSIQNKNGKSKKKKSGK